MADVNKHGLKRSDLTNEQKRIIRQQAGFGCVICGNAVGDYEHIDPEFADAKIHDPEKMAFLCIQCHGKVTRGQLSKSTVARAKLGPKALQSGFLFEAFDVGPDAPRIHFGPLSAVNCKWAIRVNGRPVFWINPPETIGGPFRLNAELRDAVGGVVFSIINNQWQTRTDKWDVEVVGRTITVRDGPGQIALKIKTMPPKELHIERMDMSIEGFKIRCDGSQFTVVSPSGATAQATQMEMDGCLAAVELDSGNIMFGFGGGRTTFSGTLGGFTPQAPARKFDKKIGRNEKCPCQSGKKYKHCCGSYR